MTYPRILARLYRAWLLAGTLAAGLSILALAAAALLRGLPGWMPLNATTHAFYGAEAAAFRGLDLAHTGLGLVIHVASAFFWAGIAVLLTRLADGPHVQLPWAAGAATAVLAGVVDYGLMPARLTPGWELVLPPAGIAAGFAALGLGLALGLWLGQRGRRDWPEPPAPPPAPRPPIMAPPPPVTSPDRRSPTASAPEERP